MIVKLEIIDPNNVITPRKITEVFVDKIFELFREFEFYGSIDVGDSYSYRVNVKPPEEIL